MNYKSELSSSLNVGSMLFFDYGTRSFSSLSSAFKRLPKLPVNDYCLFECLTCSFAPTSLEYSISDLNYSERDFYCKF
jgi:hypothetical protein